MKFYSTNKKAPEVGFKEAIFKSLPADNGLYFPESIPDLSHLNKLENASLQEVGYEIMKPFVGDEIPNDRLKSLVNDALNFEIPIVEVEKGIHSLELFHGPTYAFKDVGARFLARCLGYFNEQSSREITILVATSGDTGGAVASGFYNVPGVKVVILYPSGKVSDLQEKQLTTLGGNIEALEVDGTFDDCQALVKEAFLDDELGKHINLSSANSINIARWIPQSIYYYWSSLQFNSDQLVYSVPSGNYGNLAAGLLAKKMGAPIKRFIASSNLNDVVPRYLSSGNYEPKPTIQTYSNAMDVGKPSNFPRMLALYDHEYSQIVREIEGGRLADGETLETIQKCWVNNDYLLDPHGAIGYQLLLENKEIEEIGMFLETAHPCKFIPVIAKVVKNYTPPTFTKELLGKSKKSIKILPLFNKFKEYLLNP